jgi:signal-transduction protein with cAMP-binding, CBS, and nucleotidyltransferase domain
LRTAAVNDLITADGRTSVRSLLSVGASMASRGAGFDAEANAAAFQSRLAVFNTPVSAIMRSLGDVLAIRAGTHAGEMIALLAAGPAACAVVVDAAGQPIGIISERDIARRITYRLPPETPVEAVMTAPVVTTRRREYLYHAIAAMRRHGLRHMPVVDRDSRLVGMLHLHDALAAASARLMHQIDRLSNEGTIDGLKEVKSAQVELAEQLFADHLPAPEIQQLLTRINNDMYRSVGDAALKQMAAEGWGEPPVSAAAIVMGSGGRGENFLFPDQDNGFIIADYPDAEHARIDTFFIELAERMCRDLNEVGIPYCNGYCMAVNPLWRKTLPQWIEQIRLWGRKSNSVTIRLADIFFDFQPVSGDITLARALRQAVTEIVRHNHFFLRQMFQDKTSHNVALGFFGGFVTEKEQKEYRGQVNLKYAGTIPLVGAIRLLALREGVEETSTLQRIRVLGEQNVLSVNERDELVGAFDLLTDTLLRQQIADFRAGRRVSYFVDPNALDKRARARLVDALKAIDAVRKRAHMEFTGQIF